MKKTFVVAMLMAFLPSAVLAGETLVFASSLWPPYVTEENGELSGIDVEVVRELCSRLEIKPDIRTFPWKRALRYMEKGEADALFAPRRTPEREKFMHYPSEPIHMEKTVLIVPKGSGITIGKLDDLKGRIVGVVRGYSYDPEFDKYPHMERSICDDDEQLVKMLAHKRISVITGSDEGTMRYLCKKAGLQVEVAYVFSAIPSYIAFSKKGTGERGKILAEKFGDALRELKKEDFIAKVESRYF